MKTARYIPMLAAAAAALLAVSCVKNKLFDTPHPDHGTITVLADWSARGQGIDIPATWSVSVGDYTGTETGATHTPDRLFEPGPYSLTVWNPADGIAVSGTTATVAPTFIVHSTRVPEETGGLIISDPGWFFTHTQQVTIEKDRDHLFVAPMQQQVRELTLVIEPSGDAAGRITKIAAELSGAAGTLDFATGTYGTPSTVPFSFTKITSGADAGKWAGTVRLLGIAGSEQRLTGEISYEDNNPLPSTLESDLTEALAAFNTGKDEPLTLGGTIVKTPDAAEFTEFEVSDWKTVENDDIYADMKQ